MHVEHGVTGFDENFQVKMKQQSYVISQRQAAVAPMFFPIAVLLISIASFNDELKLYPILVGSVTGLLSLVFALCLLKTKYLGYQIAITALVLHLISFCMIDGFLWGRFLQAVGFMLLFYFVPIWCSSPALIQHFKMEFAHEKNQNH